MGRIPGSLQRLSLKTAQEDIRAMPASIAKTSCNGAVDWPFWWMPLGLAAHANGGEFLTEDGLIGLDSPEAMEGLQRITDLVYEHHVAPRSAALASLGMNNTFKWSIAAAWQWRWDGSWALWPG